MNFKRLFAMTLAGATLCAALTGCVTTETAGSSSASGDSSGSADGSYTIGYCNGADSDVFMVARKDAFIEAIDGTGIDAQFADANQDSAKQLSDADTFIARKVDCLMLVPNDSKAIVPAVEVANSAGIPVICLGIKADSGDSIFVGSENYDAGHMQGEYMAANLPEGAKVLYLAGTSGMDHSTARRQGFLDALEEAGRSDIEILADLDGNYEMAKAMQITEDWIQKFPEFDAIVAANDQMALGAIGALKGANRLEGVAVSGVDGLEEAYQAIANGEMVQTILQDAPGQASMAYEVVQKLQNGEETESEYLVPFVSVTADNLSDYYAG